LGREAVYDPLTIGILIVAAVLLVLRKLDSLWIIRGAATLELAAGSMRFVSGL
jgi:hypothetical protein